jgi:hypothetical protein
VVSVSFSKFLLQFFCVLYTFKQIFVYYFVHFLLSIVLFYSLLGPVLPNSSIEDFTCLQLLHQGDHPGSWRWAGDNDTVINNACKLH